MYHSWLTLEITCDYLHLKSTGGGTPWKMGYGYVRPRRPPFSCPPRCSQDPHFIIFSVLKTLLSPQNHQFLKILSSKASKFAKSPVPKPKIGSNFSSQGYILLRNAVHKDPKFVSGPFTSPSVRPFGPHTYTKKSWVPSPGKNVFPKLTQSTSTHSEVITFLFSLLFMKSF